MDQALDFKAECDVLYEGIKDLSKPNWNRITQFKNWTINDIISHLHFWNQMADLSLNDPDEFSRRLTPAFEALEARALKEHENTVIKLRDDDLLAEWHALVLKITKQWQALDPKQRIKWAGPDMSVRSSMTARQMETWAHGQTIFDCLGETRIESDRIKNIVILGVNTFGWTFKVNGKTIPDQMPYVSLTSPSGALWHFGEEQVDNQITGSAVEFAQIVTQTRNVKDTSIKTVGEIAEKWMAMAQCFAGPAIAPPKAGLRHKLGSVPIN